MKLSSGQKQASKQAVHALLDLPIELLSNIAKFLTPVDIVNLGICCRRLYDATQAWSVWSIALVSLCLEKQVFLPTFPISKMSTAELKEACTRPFRFRSRVWATGRESASGSESMLSYPLLAPEFTHKLPLPPTPPKQDFYMIPPIITGAHLIPGGRYLLTTDSWQRLCLWDLGYTAPTCNTTFPPRPLVEQYFRDPKALRDYDQIEHVQPTADGQGLIFTISIEDNWFGDECVLEVYPASPCPRFEIIASRAKHPRYSMCLALSSEVLLYEDKKESQLVIWYFRHGTTRTLPLLGRRFTSVSVHDQMALVIGHKDMIVLHIPPPPTHNPNNTASVAYYRCGKPSRDLSIGKLAGVCQSFPWFDSPKVQILDRMEAFVDFYLRHGESCEHKLIYSLDPPLFTTHGSPSRSGQGHYKTTCQEEYMYVLVHGGSDIHVLALRRSADGKDESGTGLLQGEEAAQVALEWNNQEHGSDESVLVEQNWGWTRFMCSFTGRLVVKTAIEYLKFLDFVA